MAVIFEIFVNKLIWKLLRIQYIISQSSQYMSALQLRNYSTLRR